MNGNHPHREGPVVAYIHHRFPSLTATFVYREVRALGEAGIEVLNFACKKPASGDVHAEAQSMIERTVYLPSLTHPLLYLGALAVFLRRPIRFVRAAWRVFTSPHRHKTRLPLAKSCAEITRGGYLARRLCKTRRVAHLHAPFSTEVATIGWVAAQLTDLPFSFTSHTAFDARMLREKLASSRFAVSISRFDKTQLVEESGASYADRVQVIHCGVKGTAPSAKGRDHNVPMVLSVGSLIEKKGHAYLIKACEILRARGEAFECRIVGGGPLGRVLQDQIRARGVDDDVALLGPRDQEEVQALYGKADVFALASIYASNGDLDGIPVALMEAMAAGVPCVSTRVSGIPELISSPAEGILVEEKDPKALADAIELLLRDEALRERIARAARAKVEREFNIEKSAAQLARLFRESISVGAAEAAHPAKSEGVTT